MIRFASALRISSDGAGLENTVFQIHPLQESGQAIAIDLAREGQGKGDQQRGSDHGQKLRRIIGLDLNSYKNQIHRRVHMLMDRWSVKIYDDYFNAIKNDDKKLREFLDHLTINVSEFFRNDSQWWKLRDQLIPELIKKRSHKRLKL